MTPVTTSRILDCLADAVTRYKVEGARGAQWTWFQGMTADEHLAFDLFLVRMGDELAYQAGSPESRWLTRVARMAGMPEVNGAVPVWAARGGNGITGKGTP